MMDKWTACEEAYKNGYEQGKKDAVGHSVWHRTDYRDYHCMNCGYLVHCPSKYCSNCGYKMDGEENG